jgi:hypothetical protein
VPDMRSCDGQARAKLISAPEVNRSCRGFPPETCILIGLEDAVLETGGQRGLGRKARRWRMLRTRRTKREHLWYAEAQKPLAILSTVERPRVMPRFWAGVATYPSKRPASGILQCGIRIALCDRVFNGAFHIVVAMQQ